jgi:hypothetical protein
MKSTYGLTSKQNEVSQVLYKELMLVAFDDIERAQMEWKKNGGAVTVLTYRKSRKSERLVRVGVKN